MTVHKRVVIVGGGVAGASLLFHLAKFGWNDALLIERNELTAGSTWHAAGNCARFTHSVAMLKIRDYSIQLYQDMEKESGIPSGFRMTGGLRPARSQDRIDEYRHFESMARANGIDVNLISVDEFKKLHPLVNPAGYIAALWDEKEGNVDPGQLTQAYARRACGYGAEIRRQTLVTGISQLANGNWYVETDKGEVGCEVLVNAAGLWGREVGLLSGLHVPIVPMQHHYLVTDKVTELDGRDKPVPLFRDGEESFYLRQERDGLIIGPYETQSAPWAVDGTPADFGMELLPDELERLETTLDLVSKRVPATNSAGIKTVFNGGITFTADGHALIGPAPGLRNYYLFTGNTAGIMESGGAGMALARWIIDGVPPMSMATFDPRRFGDFCDGRYVLERAHEIYPKTYAIGWPAEEPGSARRRRMSPIHDRLVAAGGVFGSRFGWERPNWFAPQGVVPRDTLSFRRPNWFEQVGQECKTLHETCGVIDLTSFAKFEVAGKEAESFLNRVSANTVPGKTGQIRLVHCLNHKGGVECELTLVRTGDDRFYLTAASIAQKHHMDWLNWQIRDGEQVRIRDVTDDYAILVVAGPWARKVLAGLTAVSLENDAFPWMRGKIITLAGEEILALRWTCTGELGWELHCKTDRLPALYDAIMAAGAIHRICNVGIRSLEPMRMEKGYAALTMELTSECTPFEAALDRFVDMNKGDFIGRDALVVQQQSGVTRKLVLFEVDTTDRDAMGNEPVFLNDVLVGEVTSGAYGHRVGKSLAMAYVDTRLAGVADTFEFEVLGDRTAARQLTYPPFDTGNERIRM